MWGKLSFVSLFNMILLAPECDKLHVLFFQCGSKASATTAEIKAYKSSCTDGKSTNCVQGTCTAKTTDICCSSSATNALTCAVSAKKCA